MTYIYVATRVITFFGTYLRTFFEHLACRLCGVPAEDVRAFKSSEMCGHVEHALTDSLKQSLTVTMLPFTMNLLLGSALLLTGSYRLFFAGQVDNIQPYIFTWLGFSCLANCAPSFEDVLSLKSYVFSAKKPIKIILLPIYAVYFACAFLEKYSVTFVLCAIYTYAFPWIFNNFFPLIEKMYEMTN